MYKNAKKRAGALKIMIFAVVILIIIAVSAILLKNALRGEEAAAETDAAPQNIFTLSGKSASQGELILISSKRPLAKDYSVEDILVSFTKESTEKEFVLKDSKASFLPPAANALNSMIKAAKGNKIGDYVVNSSYRSYADQERIFEGRVADQMEKGLSRAEAEKEVLKGAAKPGFSEHHTGYAVDISAIVDGKQVDFEGTDQQVWMGANCYDYGFVWRYPPYKTDVTGVMNEPWHFRYVGLPHSIIMRDKGFVLEEYLEYLSEMKEVEIAHKGVFHKVIFVPADAAAEFSYIINGGEEVSVSGDNNGNFIVTVKNAKQGAAENKDAA